MKNLKLILPALLLLLPATVCVAAEMRFPPPDFQTGYTLPDIHSPGSESSNGFQDAVILFIALSITTWIVFKSRSRRGLFIMSILSLGYFGFYRTGCICPVGSTQNVMAAVFVPDVGVSVAVLSFFFCRSFSRSSLVVCSVHRSVRLARCRNWSRSHRFEFLRRWIAHLAWDVIFTSDSPCLVLPRARDSSSAAGIHL